MTEVVRDQPTVGQFVAGGVVVRPGDTLVIAVPVGTHHEMTEALHDQIPDHLPGVKVVVLEANQLAVYRPGP